MIRKSRVVIFVPQQLGRVGTCGPDGAQALDNVRRHRSRILETLQFESALCSGCLTGLEKVPLPPISTLLSVSPPGTCPRFEKSNMSLGEWRSYASEASSRFLRPAQITYPSNPNPK